MFQLNVGKVLTVCFFFFILQCPTMLLWKILSPDASHKVHSRNVRNTRVPSITLLLIFWEKIHIILTFPYFLIKHGLKIIQVRVILLRVDHLKVGIKIVVTVLHLLAWLQPVSCIFLKDLRPLH